MQETQDSSVIAVSMPPTEITLDEQLANQLTKIEQIHQQLKTEQEKLQMLKQLESITNQDIPNLDEVQPPIKKEKGKQKANRKRDRIKLEIIDDAVKRKAKTPAGRVAAAEWYVYVFDQSYAANIMGCIVM